MKRIVICDDEPHVVEGLRYLLRGEDRQIETAGTGLEGLRLIEEQIPDLLITDVMMPEMSGLELVAELRNREPTRRLPVIIITAKGQAQDAALAQEMWGASVIGKPFDPRRIRDLVADVLRVGSCPTPAS